MTYGRRSKVKKNKRSRHARGGIPGNVQTFDDRDTARSGARSARSDPACEELRYLWLGSAYDRTQQHHAARARLGDGPRICGRDRGGGEIRLASVEER